MKEKNTYQTLLKEFEEDLDFKVECKILEITEQICVAMKIHRFNRADLAIVLESSNAAITKMLNGETNFTLKRLIKIAMSLDSELEVKILPRKKLSILTM